MSTELIKLKQALAILQSSKAQFERNIDDLSRRIERLEQQSFVQQFTNSPTNTPEQWELTSKPQPTTTPASVPCESIATTHAVIHQTDATEKTQPYTPDESVSPQTKDKVHPKSVIQVTAHQRIHPSFISQIIQLLLAQLLGPVSHLWGLGKEFYGNYQRRGIGHVFLLMLAGLITMTVGIGYLLQYSYNHLLSDLGRLTIGLGLANTILGLGIAIVVKRPKQQEYGSALVGLGLVINYLSCYVGANYYQILPPTLSLGLQALITFAGYGLAYRLNTKVVAMVALVGGILAPLLLGLGLISLDLYLPYLVLLAILSIAISHNQRWPAFIIISASLQIAVLESLIYMAQLDNNIEVSLFLHLLFYAYIGYNLTKQNRTTIPLLASLVTCFILLNIQLSTHAGSILTLNGLFWGSVYTLMRILPRTRIPFILSLAFDNRLLRQFSLIVATSFIAFAALLLLDPYLYAVIWGLEGVLLLWIGLDQRLKNIRYEAYLLLGICLGITILTTLQWIFNTSFDVKGVQFNHAVIGLLVTTLLWGIARELILRYSPNHDRFETVIKAILCEGAGILQVALLYSVGAQLLGDYALNLAPLALLILFWHAHKYRLNVVEQLGWLQLLLILSIIIDSIVGSGSLRFSAQHPLGQIAIIEFVTLMFLIRVLYRLYAPHSWFKPYAEMLRTLFYLLLPLIFLPEVMRSALPLLPLALYLSSALSLLFSLLSQNRWVKIESILLSYLTLMMIAISCWNGSVYGALALLLSLLFYTSLIPLNRYRQSKLSLPKGYHLPSALSHHFSQCYYSFALPIVIVIFSLSHNWSLALAALGGYFWLIFSITPRPISLRGSLYLNAGLAVLLSVATLTWHFIGMVAMQREWLLPTLADLIVLGCSATIIHLRHLAPRRRLIAWSDPVALFGWNLALAWGYLLWCYQFPLWVAAPLSSILLVAHGCALLFLSLRKELAIMVKLALAFFIIASTKLILLDLSSFDILQKVIVFMVIGTLLLVISYQYIRIKNRQN